MCWMIIICVVLVKSDGGENGYCYWDEYFFVFDFKVWSEEMFKRWISGKSKRWKW